MALKNLISPEIAGPRLERWYAARHPNWDDVQVTGIDIPSANGMSSETVMFDMTCPTYDLAHEQRVIGAVAASTTVPVPATYGVEEDTTVLGGPFLAMERLSGRVPADDPPFTASGWVTELSVDEQATM